MTRVLLLLVMVTVPADHATAQIPAGMKVGLVEYLQGSYEGLKGHGHQHG